MTLTKKIVVSGLLAATAFAAAALFFLTQTQVLLFLKDQQPLVFSREGVFFLASLLLAVTGLALLGGFFHYLRIANSRIRRVTRWIEGLGSGEFSHSNYLDREDEIGRLQKAVMGISATLQQSFDNRQLAAELKESEARFRALANVATEGIILHRAGAILEANQAVYTILGYKPEELVGRMVTDFMPEEFHELVRLKIGSNSEEAYEIGLLCKDGRRIISEIRSKNVPFKGKTCRVAIFRDITLTKSSQEQLRESEERFRRLSDAAFEGVSVVQEGKVVEANEGFARIFGYQGVDEVIGKSHLDFVSAEHYALVRSKVRTRDERPYEVMGVRKDGSTLVLEACGKTVQYRGKEARVAALRDITERKHAETSLRESEERFRMLSEVAFEAVVIHKDFSIVEVNQAFLEMFGFPSREAVLGMPVLNLIAPEFREQMIEKAISTDSKSFEITMTDHNQAKKVVAVRSRFIPYGNGTAHVVTLNDITERKRTEIVLMEREARLTMLVEQMPACLWTIDRNLLITSSVGAGLKELGVKPGELVGKTLFQYLGTEDPHCEQILIHRKVLAGESVTKEANWMGRTFQTHVEPLRNALGEVTGAIGLSIDLTDVRNNEEKLRATAAELMRSNRELEQFAYVASHDLQEPLRMISSYIDLLDRKYGGLFDPDGKEYMRFAVDGAKRMKQQIDDLLTYSRVTRRSTTFSEVDCLNVVERVRSDLRLVIMETGAQIDVTSLPVVVADPAQLGQLFQNLISNALKFRSVTNPEISISAKRVGLEWEFTVQDNGIGIEVEYSDRIFMIFQRLHSTSEYPGTGIGLAICKKIVERHGGRIWVEPRREGGSQFKFTLPWRLVTEHQIKQSHSA